MPYPVNQQIVIPVGTQIVSGTNAVGAAAAALNGGAAIFCKSVTLQSRNGNLGAIFLGDSTVTAGTRGIRLAANDIITVTIDDVSKIFAIATLPDQQLDWVLLR